MIFSDRIADMPIIAAYTTTTTATDDFAMWFFFWAGVGILVFGLLGAAIGSSKGMTGTGLLLGALLGLIGIIILLFMKPANQPAAGTYAPATAPGATIVGWHPDPTRRYQLRYYDGAAWTPQVSNSGVQANDPLPADALAYLPPPVPVPVATYYSEPFSSVQRTAPTFSTKQTRKWDKKAKQWIVQTPDGQWMSEESLGSQPDRPAQGRPGQAPPPPG